MVDFGLFCDINNCILFDKASEGNVDFTYGRLAENANEQAVYELINNCDAETIRRLIEYFDRTAPIQCILKERLEKLTLQLNGENISQYIEKNVKQQTAFYPYLAELIDEKGFGSDSDFYNYIGMSRQTFAKLRKSDAKISRPHALLMAVGLHLNYNEAVSFMERAGYAFKISDTREAIISYVMRTQKYDLMKMEEILYDFGEASLMDL